MNVNVSPQLTCKAIVCQQIKHLNVFTFALDSHKRDDADFQTS